MTLLSRISSRAARWTLAVVMALGTVLCGGGVAWAFWIAGGTGTGSATTGTLNPPTNVTASNSPGSGTVSVGWTASASSSGAAAPSGYYVTRVSSGGSAPACETSPTALTTNVSCSDTSVPDGSYTYVVTAVRSSWTAGSGPSNSITVTNIRPAVTVNQASGQSDPTNAAPISFTAAFSEPVTDFDASKVTVGGTAPGSKTVSISGTGPTYTISVTGMTGTGTVTASIAANTVYDQNGAGNTASTSTDNTVTYDVTAPTAPTPGLSAAATSGTSPVYVSNEVVTLTDSATDADTGVASVSYYYCAGASGSCTSANGTLIGTSSTASNDSVSWNPPLPAEGTYRVVALATDEAGNTAISGPVQIAIDKTAPSVSAPIVNGRS